MTIEYLHQRRAEMEAERKQHEANALAAHGAVTILSELITLAEREAAEAEAETEQPKE